MAEGLLKHWLAKEGLSGKTEVRSAGIASHGGSSANDNAILVCSRHGIDISNHRSCSINEDLLDWADLILVMDRAHQAMLVVQGFHRGHDIHLLGEYEEGRGEDADDIEDPYGYPEEIYDKTFDKIEKCMTGLVMEMKQRLNAG